MPKIIQPKASGSLEKHLKTQGHGRYKAKIDPKNNTSSIYFDPKHFRGSFVYCIGNNKLT